MDALIRWVLENMTLATLLAALVLGAIGAIRKANAPGGGWEPLSFWLLVLFVGVSGSYAGLFHLFFPVQAAAAIGWTTSPFQWEVGVADLALGVLGFMAARATRAFRWAVVVGLTVFFWGDAIGHIRQMLLTSDFAPGNAGSWFWIDVIGPVFLLIAHVKNRNDRIA